MATITMIAAGAVVHCSKYDRAIDTRHSRNISREYCLVAVPGWRALTGRQSGSCQGIPGIAASRSLNRPAFRCMAS